MKHLISMDELDKKDIEHLLNRADDLKSEIRQKNGKTAALLFNRPSTRTHVSFEVALQHMGYGSVYLDYVFTQLVRGEQLKDTARAISQYVDLIIARLVPHAMLAEVAKHASVPVINAGSDLEHPCQALGDLYTIKEAGKLRQGNTIVFLGDPTDAVAHSLAIGALKMGLKFTYVCPKGYEPSINNASVSHDPAAVNEASVIYTNAWARETTEQYDPMLIRDLLPYQVNDEILNNAPPDTLVMHPLPANRGVEITDGALDHKNSVVWKQVKNRLSVQKALLSFLVK